MTAVHRAAICRSLVLVSALVASGASLGPKATQRGAKNNRSVVVGPVTKAQLQEAPYAFWFESQYASYEPRAKDVASLRGLLEGISVEAYFGAWCGDSRRQIPRLLKLLDLAGVDEQHLSLVTLSDRPMEFKQAPGHPEAKRRVHRTPTMVFVRAGVEVGRIVETPVLSLEEDLMAILQGHGPAPHYGAEAWVHDLFIDLPPEDVEAALLSAGPEMLKKGDADSLWHYAEFDLLKNGRAREAKAVLDLHLKLNPPSAIGHVLMSDALVVLGRKAEAVESIERALAIEPGNTRALRAAEELRGAKN